MGSPAWNFPRRRGKRDVVVIRTHRQDEPPPQAGEAKKIPSVGARQRLRCAGARHPLPRLRGRTRPSGHARVTEFFHQTLPPRERGKVAGGRKGALFASPRRNASIAASAPFTPSGSFPRKRAKRGRSTRSVRDSASAARGKREGRRGANGGGGGLHRMRRSGSRRGSVPQPSHSSSKRRWRTLRPLRRTSLSASMPTRMWAST